MNQLKEFFSNIGHFIGRMAPSQVMMLFGVTAGVIVGIVFLSGVVNDIRYTPLYSELDQADAGEVIAYLDDNKISYKVTGNGTTIEVPSSDVYKTRIALAADGMPRGGSIGYSIFDKNNLGMTDFIQNLNFRRALEGELTRTIMQLSEVQAARVHIVMPKERLFKEDKLEATASVVLKLSGKNGLSKRQINGISHLVASSVEGLKPNNISILDSDGNLLTSNQARDELAGLSSSQLEVRKNVEHYLENKAQSMMDGVLGKKKAIVRITADLNFQQLERTTEAFDPNLPSVRSEQRTVASNTSSDKAQENSESSEDGSQETTITNYELNKTVEHIINEVGSINRLSVAVLVDGIYEDVENADGVIESIYQPRPQEDIDRLASIVRNAVGFDQTRNDQIEILNTPFDHQDLQVDRDLLDSMYLREFYLDLATKIGIVLLVIFGFFYLKKKSKKLFGALKNFVPPSKPQLKSHAIVDMPSESEIHDEQISSIEPEIRKPRLTDQMQMTAKEKPDEIAKVIKTMMIE